MTEQQEAAQPVAMPEQEIDFQGRMMWVRMPTPEQLLVWKRTLNQLQNSAESDWTGETVMRALERSRKIIDSVLVHTIDKDWLDDEMLDGRLSLKDTAPIIQLAVEAFTSAAEAEGNRDTRRAAKKAPAKKAARKKAASR